MKAEQFGLTEAGCRGRSAELAAALNARGVDAALLFDARHIHSLCGHWTRPHLQSILLITAEGESVLSTPIPPPLPVFANETIVFESSKTSTLIDDPITPAMTAVKSRLGASRKIWSDRAIEDQSLAAVVRQHRRKKGPDEIALLEHSIRACESAYARAREIIQPGLTEFELYIEILAAASRAAGEPIGELGNDFQSGSPGGGARHRAMQAGELLPLDLSVIVRGYASDLCRTFAVDRNPTDLQQVAHEKVVEALRYVESAPRPGVSCRKLFHDVKVMLDGFRGWNFSHHLGHGIGIYLHEAPRLNPDWDDVFAPGDVFTAEPGIYSPQLRAGIRLEENYLVTETGVRKLSSFPLAL